MAKKCDNFKNIILEISKEAERKNRDLYFFHTGLNDIKSAKYLKNSQVVNDYLEKLKPLPWKLEESSLQNFINDPYLSENSKLFYISSSYDFDNYLENLKKFEKIKNKNADHIILNPVKTLLMISDLIIKQNTITAEVTRLEK